MTTATVRSRPERVGRSSSTLRNYSHLASSQAVTLTLQTESPYVEVIDDSMVVGVTTDMEAELQDTFSIRVVPEAPSGSISLSLVAEASDASVSPHSELAFTVFVAGGGLLVWEGVEGGATFSGQYLRDELDFPWIRRDLCRRRVSPRAGRF